MTDPLLPPDELIDGHTLDELSAYLAAGRQPADPTIDDSPQCRAALTALERLGRATQDLLDEEAAARPAEDDWVGRILTGIRLDVQSGRRIPISHPDPAAELALTEGAVRALVRGVGDDIDGVLVGRCRLDGEVETPGAPIAVHVEISVRYGVPMTATAEAVRNAVAAELARHAELTITSVDVLVTDVREPRTGKDA
ncbi:Asp23/Gls24 family envelope stress response protein [Leifsonia aquatica]|uniref:Asp23/Gls24 family envelope stress response protein n=1 Tax=Leifsonia aquatica TaxID=144185 RepID=UPI000469E022|nr:Asp23/Gls24 family envelope stress response protein [Leifsonia aquatica]